MPGPRDVPLSPRDRPRSAGQEAFRPSYGCFSNAAGVGESQG